MIRLRIKAWFHEPGGGEDNQINMKEMNLMATLAAMLVTGVGCGSGSQTEVSPGGAAPHSHAEAPVDRGPHGGVPVEVGSHAFHLELVNHMADGKMLAYVMDAHLERELKVPPTTFDLVARMNGEEHRATFSADTNAPAGGVSVFSATADWLRTATNFQGEIPSINLAGRVFQNVPVRYPEGTLHRH